MSKTQQDKPAPESLDLQNKGAATTVPASHKRNVPQESSLYLSHPDPTPNSQSSKIETRAILEPPTGQFFTNALLQSAAIAAAIAFGVFAVKSVNIANAANAYAAAAVEQARLANQVALLAFCLSADAQVC